MVSSFWSCGINVTIITNAPYNKRVKTEKTFGVQSVAKFSLASFLSSTSVLKLSRSISISRIRFLKSLSASLTITALSGSRSIRSSISLAVAVSGSPNFLAAILTAIPAIGPPAALAMVGANDFNNPPNFILSANTLL